MILPVPSPAPQALAPKLLWTLDGSPGPGSPVSDIEDLIAAAGAAVRAGDGHVLDTSHVIFPNGALTLVLILAESHLAIHTWPEEDLVAVDLFTCGAIDADRVLTELVTGLRLTATRVQQVSRGAARSCEYLSVAQQSRRRVPLSAATGNVCPISSAADGLWAAGLIQFWSGRQRRSGRFEGGVLGLVVMARSVWFLAKCSEGAAACGSRPRRGRGGEAMRVVGPGWTGWRTRCRSPAQMANSTSRSPASLRGSLRTGAGGVRSE